MLPIWTYNISTLPETKPYKNASCVSVAAKQSMSVEGQLQKILEGITRSNYLIDHVQCAFKDSIKDLRYFSSNVPSQLVYDNGHCTKYFWLPGSWNVPLVIYKNCVQQRWNKVFSYLEGKNSNGLTQGLL